MKRLKRQEAKRLFEAIGQSSRWNMRICRSISPLTLEINQLKKEKDVFLIAHSYQTPDIVYGVADSVSDSYTLSKGTKGCPSGNDTFLKCKILVETAKIVSPHKTVLHPSPDAGCSLSDGISAEDVIKLSKNIQGCLLHATLILQRQ